MSKKKHKRGDVRDDGMVFWCYSKKCINGEYWINPEKYNKIKEKHEAARKNNKRKKGDIRKLDGMVFWSVNNGKESWVSPKKFIENKKRDDLKLSNKKKEFNLHARTLRCGDCREFDNKIFWRYSIGANGFEEWVDPDKFIEKKSMWSSSTRRKARRKSRTFKRANDPIYKLKCNTRSLIWKAIQSHGYTKKSKTHKLIGCSYEKLKPHLEAQFTDGMSWSNMGDWHVDHIIPLAAAKTEDELIKLCHYTNLQPLWAEDNRRKGDKHDPAELKAYLAA